MRLVKNSVRREVGDLQWVRIPSGQLVARPEAIRAMKDQAACVNKSSTRDTGQQTAGLDMRFLTHIISTGKRPLGAFETDLA